MNILEIASTTILPVDITEHGQRTYRVYGATFDGQSQTTIEASTELSLHIEPSPLQSSPRAVMLYGTFAGRERLLDTWIVNQPSTESITHHYRTRGFYYDPDAPAQDLILGKVSNAIEAGTPIKDLPTAEWLPDLPASLIFDRATSTVYRLNLFSELAEARLYSYKTENGLVDLFAKYSDATKRRQVTFVYASGLVAHLQGDLEDYRRSIQLDLDGAIVRARRTPETDIYLITERGTVYRISDALQEATKLDIDDVVADYCPTTGAAFNLYGAPIQGLPENFEYYELKDGTAYALNSERKPVAIDIATQTVTELGPEIGTRLPHSVDYAASTSIAYTYGDGTLVLDSGPVTSVDDTLNVLAFFDSNMTGGDQLYVARPTADIKHFAEADYTATLADVSTDLGPTVTYTLNVKASDVNALLPITLPEGVEWTAVNQLDTEVRYAQDGDTLTITATHPTITELGFPTMIGRSGALIYEEPDFLPNPVRFDSFNDCTLGATYETNEVTLTGFNQPLELRIEHTPPSPEDPIGVTVFVDDVAVELPTTVYENNRVKLKILHDQPINTVDVYIGDYKTTTFTATESVPVLNVPQHVAYFPSGNMAWSSMITNPSNTWVDVKLLTPGAVWASTLDEDGKGEGSQTTRIQPGKQDRIRYFVDTPTHHEIVYETKHDTYSWFLWADSELLDPQPEPTVGKYQQTLTLPDFLQPSIPSDFVAHLRLPAGVNVYKNGDILTRVFDSRGFMAEPGRHQFKPGLDSIKLVRQTNATPTVLTYGDAEIVWETPFDVEFTHEAIPSQEATTIEQDWITQPFRDAGSSFEAPRVRHVKHVPNVSAVYVPQPKHIQSASSRSFGGFYPVSTRIQDKSHYHDAATPVHVSVRGNTVDAPTARRLTYSSYVQDARTARAVVFPDLYNGSKPEGIYRTYTHSRVTRTYRYVPPSVYPVPIFGWRWLRESAPYKVDSSVARYVTTLSHPLKLEINVIRSQGEMSGYPVAMTWHHVEASKVAGQSKLEPRHLQASEVHLFDIEVARKADRPPIKVDSTFVHVASHSAYKHGKLTGRFVDTNVNQIEGSGLATNHWRLRVPDTAAALEPRLVRAFTMNLTAPRVPKLARLFLRKHPAALEPRYVRARPSRTDAATLPRYAVGPVHRVDASVNISHTNHIERRLHDMPPFYFENVNLTSGEDDPLKQGYFATELDALQNAVDVWGREAYMVYGIQHPEGYWTWADAQVCGETCGTISCNARGYLSGG